MLRELWGFSVELIFLRLYSAASSHVKQVEEYAKQKQYRLKSYTSGAEPVTKPWQERHLGALIQSLSGRDKQIVIYDVAEQVCDMQQAFSLMQRLHEAKITLHIVKLKLVLLPEHYNQSLIDNIRCIARAINKKHGKANLVPARRRGRPQGTSEGLRVLDSHKNDVVHDLQVMKLSRNEVSGKYGVARQTLEMWLVRNRIYVRTVRKLDRYRDEIKQYLDEGKTYTEIARILRVNPTTVSRFVAEEGWK